MTYIYSIQEKRTGRSLNGFRLIDHKQILYDLYGKRHYITVPEVKECKQPDANSRLPAQAFYKELSYYLYDVMLRSPEKYTTIFEYFINTHDILAYNVDGLVPLSFFPISDMSATETKLDIIRITDPLHEVFEHIYRNFLSYLFISFCHTDSKMVPDETYSMNNFPKTFCNYKYAIPNQPGGVVTAANLDLMMGTDFDTVGSTILFHSEEHVSLFKLCHKNTYSNSATVPYNIEELLRDIILAICPRKKLSDQPLRLFNENS